MSVEIGARNEVVDVDIDSGTVDASCEVDAIMALGGKIITIVVDPSSSSVGLLCARSTLGRSIQYHQSH